MKFKDIAFLAFIGLVLALLMFMGLGMASNMPTCQDQTNLDMIPCLGITKVLECSGNLSVTNINTSEIYNITTSPLLDGTYNFTFNFSQSSYSLVACDNSTALITVGDFEGDQLWKASMMIGFLGIASLFGVAGKILFESKLWIIKSFLYVSSVLIALISVQAGLILSNSFSSQISGLFSISSIITISSIVFLIVYMLLFATISLFRAINSKKKEEQE